MINTPGRLACFIIQFHLLLHTADSGTWIDCTESPRESCQKCVDVGNDNSTCMAPSGDCGSCYLSACLHSPQHSTDYDRTCDDDVIEDDVIEDDGIHANAGLIAIMVLSAILLIVIVTVFAVRRKRTRSTQQSVRNLNKSQSRTKGDSRIREELARGKQDLMKSCYSLRTVFRVGSRLVMVWDMVSDLIVMELLVEYNSDWAWFMLFTIIFPYFATVVILAPTCWEYLKLQSAKRGDEASPGRSMVLFLLYGLPAMIIYDVYLVLSSPFRAPDQWILLYSQSRAFCEVTFEAVPQLFFQGWILTNPDAIEGIQRSNITIFVFSVVGSVFSIIKAFFEMREFHYLSTNIHAHIRPYVATIRSNATKKCSISYVELSHHELEIICLQITTHSYSIQEFRFEHLKLTDEQCNIISSLFKDNKSIKTLCLDNNDISDEGLRSLCYSLAHDKVLTHFMLDGNCITDDGIIALSELLQQEESGIMMLSIQNNLIGPEGAERLVALSQNARIQDIKISMNRQIPTELSDRLKDQLEENRKYRAYNMLRMSYGHKLMTHREWKQNGFHNQTLEQLMTPCNLMYV